MGGTLKTKFGLGITVIYLKKKKEKPDTLEFNSKENLSIVNEFTTSTGYCLALCLFSCSSEASLLLFHCFMGYGGLYRAPHNEAEVMRTG